MLFLGAEASNPLVRLSTDLFNNRYSCDYLLMQRYKGAVYALLRAATFLGFVDCVVIL